MPLVLHLAWLLMSFLRYGGVIVIFAGVGLFGIYFIGGNAKSTNGAVPSSSWQGKGPIKGVKIAAMGGLMLLGAYAIGLFMPDGS